MNRNGAQGAGVVYGMSPAANQEFTGMVNALDGLSRLQAGWDPYEVWRIRVKGSASVMPERKRGPLR